VITKIYSCAKRFELCNSVSPNNNSIKLLSSYPKIPTTARGPTGTKIYVGNLNFETTMEEVQSAFAAYGEVKDCFIPLDYDGNPRGFAFVLMDEENALAAIEGLDGTELGGRSLNVKKSLPKGEKAVAKGKPLGHEIRVVCVCVCVF
jgi:RNA recognition motif-containing protein